MKDPFILNGEYIEQEFRVEDYKSVIENFWGSALKPCIHKTLTKSKNSLDIKELDAVLMSGGGSQIGWFKELIKKNFKDIVEPHSIIEIKEYKNVVSKGLAIECAIRNSKLKSEKKEIKIKKLKNNIIDDKHEFNLVKKEDLRTYNQNQSFKNVTYNTLDLIFFNEALEPEEPNYKLKSTESSIECENYSLIKAAANLNDFIGKPIKWDVFLSEKPKNKLDYIFTNKIFTKLEINQIIEDNGFFSHESRLNYSQDRLIIKKIKIGKNPVRINY